MTDRDTHFAGFARLHYPELERLFADLFWCRMYGQYDKARITEMVIKDLIAQHAYDLVEYAVKSFDLDPAYYDTDTIIAEVPDMTEWPTTAE